MPSRIVELVVDAQNGDARELHAIDVDASRADAASRERPAESGASTEKCDPRPTVETTPILWSRTRAMRSTIERPSPKPARHLGTLVEAVEFLENCPFLR